MRYSLCCFKASDWPQYRVFFICLIMLNYFCQHRESIDTLSWVRFWWLFCVECHLLLVWQLTYHSIQLFFFVLVDSVVVGRAPRLILFASMRRQRLSSNEFCNVECYILCEYGNTLTNARQFFVVLVPVSCSSWTHSPIGTYHLAMSPATRSVDLCFFFCLFQVRVVVLGCRELEDQR